MKFIDPDEQQELYTKGIWDAFLELYETIHGIINKNVNYDTYFNRRKDRC